MWWQILGIEYTDDLDLIKKAYQEKIKGYHYEDNPEEYERIKSAYEQGSKYARHQKRARRLQREREDPVVLEEDSAEEDLQIKDPLVFEESEGPKFFEENIKRFKDEQKDQPDPILKEDELFFEKMEEELLFYKDDLKTYENGQFRERVEEPEFKDQYFQMFISNLENKNSDFAFWESLISYLNFIKDKEAFLYTTMLKRLERLNYNKIHFKIKIGVIRRNFDQSIQWDEEYLSEDFKLIKSIIKKIDESNDFGIKREGPDDFRFLWNIKHAYDLNVYTDSSLHHRIFSVMFVTAKVLAYIISAGLIIFFLS